MEQRNLRAHALRCELNRDDFLSKLSITNLYNYKCIALVAIQYKCFYTGKYIIDNLFSYFIVYFCSHVINFRVFISSHKTL